MNAPLRRTQPLGASFAFALDGVLRTLVGERNMKIHWVSGTAVMLVGMALDLPMSARAALLFAMLLVLATEVLNAAIEGVVNLATETWAFSAKLAKDAAAGTVLLVALGAAIILADLLHHNWSTVESSGSAVLRTVLLGVPLLGALWAHLTAPRTRAWMAGSLGVTVATYVPLAVLSEDYVFSLMCALFIMGAAVCRLREPYLLDQRPPERDVEAAVEER